MEVAAPVLNLGMEPLELEACRRGVSLLTGDRYDVIRPLGRGGMSVVLLGLDRQEGRRVALKLLDPAQGASVENRERFRREALISAELEHPHIVPCYQFVHHNRLALAIMRYIPGRSLADRLGDLAASKNDPVGLQLEEENLPQRIRGTRKQERSKGK